MIAEPATIEEPATVSTDRVPFSQRDESTPPSYLATEERDEAATQPMVVTYLYALLWHRFFRWARWWLIATPIVLLVGLLVLLFMNANVNAAGSNGINATIVTIALFVVIGGGLLVLILLKPSVQHIAAGNWLLRAEPFGADSDDYLLLDSLKERGDDSTDKFQLPRADQTALLNRTNATLAIAPTAQANPDAILPLDAQAVMIENLAEIGRITAAQEYTEYPAYALATDSEAFGIIGELLGPLMNEQARVQMTAVQHDYTVEELPNEDEDGIDDEERLRRRIITINAKLDAQERANSDTAIIAAPPPAPATDTASLLPGAMPLDAYRSYVNDLVEFAALAAPLLNIWQNQREGLGGMRAWSTSWRQIAEFWRKQTESHHTEVADLLTAANTMFTRAADALAYEIKPLLEQVEADRALMEARTRQLSTQRIQQATAEFGRRIDQEQQLQAELSGKEVAQREMIGRLEQRERSEEATLARLRDELAQTETQIEVRINQAMTRIKNASKNPYPVDVGRSTPREQLPNDPIDAYPRADRKLKRIAGLYNEVGGPVSQLIDRYEMVRQQANILTQTTVPYDERLRSLGAMLTLLRTLRGEMSSEHDVIVGLSRDVTALNQELATYIAGLPRMVEADEEAAAARQKLLQVQNQTKTLQQQIDGLHVGNVYNQLDTNVKAFEELNRALPAQVQIWQETAADIDDATAAVARTREEHQRALEGWDATKQQIEDSQRKEQQLIASRDREIAEQETRLDVRLRVLASDAARQQEEIRRHLTELEQAHSDWQRRHANLAEGSFSRYINFDAESMELKAETVEGLLDYIEGNLRRASQMVEDTQNLLTRCLFAGAKTNPPATPLSPLLHGPVNFLVPVWLAEYRPWLFGRRTYYALTPVTVRFDRRPRWGEVGAEMTPRSAGAQTLFASRTHLSSNGPLIRYIARNSLLASRDNRDNLRSKIDHLAQVGFINFALTTVLKFTLGWRNLFDFAPRKRAADITEEA